MRQHFSRRNFIGGAVGTAATHTAHAAGDNTLPTRLFGRSGRRATVLAIGCGNRLWAAYKTEEKGVEAVASPSNPGFVISHGARLRRRHQRDLGRQGCQSPPQ